MCTTPEASPHAVNVLFSVEVPVLPGPEALIKPLLDVYVERAPVAPLDGAAHQLSQSETRAPRFFAEASVLLVRKHELGALTHDVRLHLQVWRYSRSKASRTGLKRPSTIAFWSLWVTM